MTLRWARLDNGVTFTGALPLRGAWIIITYFHQTSHSDSVSHFGWVVKQGVDLGLASGEAPTLEQAKKDSLSWLAIYLEKGAAVIYEALREGT